MKKISITLVVCLYSIISLYPSINDLEQQIQTTSNTNSIIKKIADINLKTFDWKEDSWSTNSFVEAVKRIRKDILNLKPNDKRRIAFNIFEEIEKQSISNNPGIDNSNTWKDLDLFCGKAQQEKFVANSLDRTTTELGKISFYWLLTQPTTNTSLLNQRQTIITAINNNKELLDTVTLALQKFKESENVLFSFWGRNSFKQWAEGNTFNKIPLLEKLSDSETALLAKNLFDHQNRISYLGIEAFAAFVFLSYGILTLSNIINVPERLRQWTEDYKGTSGLVITFLWNNINNRYIHSLLAIVAGLLCATNLRNSLDSVRGNIMLENCLQTFMINIATITQSMRTIYTTVKTSPGLSEFEEFKPLIDFFEHEATDSQKLYDLLDLLNDDTFQGQERTISHKGFIIRAYLLMHELKEKFEQALAATARVDAYVSLAKLVKEHDGKNVSYCFPVYTRAEKPCLKISGFWHPMLNPEQAIPNTITLGTDNQRANAVITGPNEGGKSTSLKSLALCLLMAQTCGIAPAQSMTLTPFSSIETYLNITDDIGQGNSLFKAEVLRAQQLIDRIKNSNPGIFNFVIFDEIFNGTSPIEGSAAAYSVAKHLSQFPNSICLVATHFSLLTQLEAKTDTFSNYKVSVMQTRDGALYYPHVLEQGISTQHIALDILRNQGFASTIIDEAQDIINCTR
jgi:DNA mismatch repair protein MutS